MRPDGGGELSQRSSLRVGIMGASCTGKTTLSSALAQALGIVVAIEGAREAACAIGITDSNEVCPANARDFQRLVLDIKIQAETQLLPSYISDRTVIDCAAFWLYRELKGVLAAPELARREYFLAVEQYLESRPYDIIFFLENGAFPWQSDGFRIEDQEPMTALLLGVAAGRFRHVLARTGTDLVMVPREISASETRVSFCLRTIKALSVKRV
jgi:nicotinamide riboside kinase